MIQKLPCFKCHSDTATLTYEENRIYKVVCPCGCEYDFEHSSMKCAEEYHFTMIELHGEIDRAKALQEENERLKQEQQEMKLQILSNFISNMPKIYRQRNVNSSVVRDILLRGTNHAGQGSCINECVALEIDPDGYDFVKYIPDIITYKNYSLINVSKNNGEYVDGVWMQDCSGATLEHATKRARDTETVNGEKITVAVIDSISSGAPDYSIRRGLKRLDV